MKTSGPASRRRRRRHLDIIAHLAAHLCLQDAAGDDAEAGDAIEVLLRHIGCPADVMPCAAKRRMASSPCGRSVVAWRRTRLQACRAAAGAIRAPCRPACAMRGGRRVRLAAANSRRLRSKSSSIVEVKGAAGCPDWTDLLLLRQRRLQVVRTPCPPQQRQLQSDRGRMAAASRRWA